MLSVESAQESILAQIKPLGAETVTLHEAYGRVLAHDLVVPIDLPPFANSSMDGYAVRAIDLAGADPSTPVPLRVVGTVAAGSIFAGEIQPGQAVRIFTGGALPAGADAVVMQEETAVGDEGTVLVSARVTVGQNVRLAGSDVRAGTTLVPRGATCGPSEIGAAAAAGFGVVRVSRRPWVAIVSTGDELVDPGRPLGPGLIYNSNAAMLAAAVYEAGGEPLPLPCAHDTEGDIRSALDQAQAADLIITSGGVSVGEYDLVRSTLERMGRVDFWRVNVRPGKPTAFGWLSERPLLGLPGNPASSAVTFELFVRPAIRALLGCARLYRQQISARLGVAIARGDRRHYVRARLSYEDGQVIAVPNGDQGSHRISSLLGSQSLLIISEGEGDVAAGEIVPALLLT